MKHPNQNQIQLTVGSHYRITSMGSRDEPIESRGEFKGMVSVGSVDAIALELDGEGDEEGLMRVIPSHFVLAIDILEAADEEDTGPEDDHIHYT